MQVALREFEGAERLKIDKYAKPLALMCKSIHQKVDDMSERFYAELRRKNYTTPTSYLQLIFIYKKILEEKIDSLPF